MSDSPSWPQPDPPVSPGSAQRPATTPIGPVPTQQLPVPQPPPPAPGSSPTPPSYASYTGSAGFPPSSPPPATPSWPAAPAYPPPGYAAPGYSPGSSAPKFSPGYAAPAPGYAAPAPAAPGYAAPSTPPAGPRPGRTGRVLAAAAGVGLTAGLLGGAGVVFVDHWRTSGQGVATAAPVPGSTTRPEGSIARIAAKALPSVVTVKILTADGAGNGSGFVIDADGHVLTNNHVVAEADSITVETQDGRDLTATVVGRDASYDLAVLSVSARDLPPLEWGRSADVVVGDGVIAVGAPLGLDSTVTSGIVSALNRPVAAGGADDTSYINAIQTDAAINPGNSGGPLLDLNGRVIGVNSAIARDPGSTGGVSGSIGVGFAIPSDQAVKTAKQLITTGKATHPIIGVNLDRSYTGEGVRIADSGVQPGSPAETAGLRPGDVIVALDGKKMSTVNNLVVAIRSRDVGDTVRVTVQRGGQQLDVTLQLQSSG